MVAPLVSRASAAARSVLAVALLVACGLALRRLDPDWAAVVCIFGLLAVAYLALTAATRIDPVALALGSTGGPPGARRLKRRLQRRKGRPRPA